MTASAPRGVRVLTFYTDLDVYRDRALMLKAAAAEVDHVTILSSSVSEALRDELAHPNLTVETVSARKLPRAPLQALLAAKLPGRISRDAVTLVHDTQAFLLPLFAWLRLRTQRPVLLTSSFTASYVWYETLRHSHPYRSLPYLRHRWEHHLEEKAQCHLADAVTVFGEDHRAPLAQCHGIDASKVHSLPNCADPETFRPVAPDRSGLDLPPGARFLLYVGNVFRYKGAYELLRALAVARRRFPDVHLVLLGDVHPEERAPLLAEVQALGLEGVVHFVARLPRSRVPGLLCAADALVFPSWMEGSPRAVIEAMACERPVVATRLPGIRTLDPHERALRLCAPQDTAALAAALEGHLASSAEERAGRAALGRARFLEHHTPAAAAGPLVELWRTLTQSTG